MAIKETVYNSTDEIVYNADRFVARPIRVSDANVTAVNGKKIVKRGSLLDKDGKIKNDATVKYVLLHDVDVTNGANNGTGIYKGTLNIKKIETITGVTITDLAKGALKGIFFMKDENMDY